MRSETASARPVAARSGRYRAVRALLAIAIVYGSLFPFNYVAPASLPEAWRAFWSNTRLFTSIGDVLGNVALFVPWGFAAVVLRNRASLGILVGEFVVAVLLALGAQLLQIWFPDRNPALSDVVWNVVGAIAGMAAGLFFAQGRHSATATSFDASAAASIVALFVAAQLVPFVPSLDWQLIKDQLKPLLERRWDVAVFLFEWVGYAVSVATVKEAMGTRKAVLVGLILPPVIVVGKLMVVGQSLNLSTIAGLAAGAITLPFVVGLRGDRRRLFLLAGLFAAIAARSLTPFALREFPGPFHWIPFEAFLNGSMLINAQGLAADLFLITSSIWIAAQGGRRVVGTAVGIALIWLLLEGLKIFVAGRSGDITRPLLAVAIGFAISRLRSAAPAAAMAPAAKVRAPEPEPEEVRRSDMSRFAAIVGTAAVIAACVALASGWVLRLPQMPYNVYKLFLWDANFFARFIFGIALLSLAMGPSALGRLLANSPHSMRALSAGLWLSALLTLTLLVVSVAPEKLDKICGANNRYWYIVNQEIWGTGMRDFALAVGTPWPFAFVERIVRFTALSGPLIIFIAAFTAFGVMAERGALFSRRSLAIVLCAIPWLVFCKYITFTWSSTDNLNELIAHKGDYGIGGGPALFLLVMLIAACGVLIARYRAFARGWWAACLLAVIAVPLGWWLLNNGLEQHVNKYERVFSGAQFLLGPNRDDKLDDRELFARWAALQIGAVSLIALGGALVRRARLYRLPVTLASPRLRALARS